MELFKKCPQAFNSEMDSIQYLKLIIKYVILFDDFRNNLSLLFCQVNDR